MKNNDIYTSLHDITDSLNHFLIKNDLIKSELDYLQLLTFYSENLLSPIQKNCVSNILIDVRAKKHIEAFTTALVDSNRRTSNFYTTTLCKSYDSVIENLDNSTLSEAYHTLSQHIKPDSDALSAPM